MDQVLEAPPVEEISATPSETPPANDPFSLDESSLASLAPEARVAFDNAVKTWRTKADEFAKSSSQKAVEEATSKFKDYL